MRVPLGELLHGTENGGVLVGKLYRGTGGGGGARGKVLQVGKAVSGWMSHADAGERHLGGGARVGEAGGLAGLGHLAAGEESTTGWGCRRGA